MSGIYNFNLVEKDKNAIALIDNTRILCKIFPFPKKTQEYMFILCNAGECTLSTYLTEYTLSRNSFVTIMPNSFLHVTHQSPECELYIIAFNMNIISDNNLLISTLSYLPLIIQTPVLALSDEKAKIILEYFSSVIKWINLNPFNPDKGFYRALMMTLIHGIGTFYGKEWKNGKFGNRGEEIVKKLIILMSKFYATERSASFYAAKLNITPQHLSSTVNKITGKTVTDIISNLIIADAEAKLKSTDLTIQEIAYSLNFPDISTFGKYFKRQTGMSPKKYRET